MEKYAKIIDVEIGLCEVGLGDLNDPAVAEFYKSLGMEIMDVEQSADGNWYVSGEVPENPIFTKTELTAFVSAEADKVAYGGITVIADGQEYLFKTDSANISRCGAVLPVYETMADDQVIPWEVWKNDLIFMLPVSKIQFKNGYLFGVQMIVRVQTIKGEFCAMIQNFTDDQLSDADYIIRFKENVIQALSQINTVFDMNI